LFSYAKIEMDEYECVCLTWR